jgi:hypothetical protein
MPESHRFKSLSLSSLRKAPRLPQTQRHATPHEPALSLLTDLHHSACVVASDRDGLDQTLHLMMRAGVRMVFVAGPQGDLVGMVTAEDLQGERPVVKASSHQMAHDELTLADIMIPISHWDTVELSAVRTARLGDIAETMHQHGLRYLLVTQLKDGQTVLRGLFSARRLEMALNMTIEADMHSRSFAELEQVLAH